MNAINLTNTAFIQDYFWTSDEKTLDSDNFSDYELGGRSFTAGLAYSF